MNIVRTPHLLKHSVLLLSLVSGLMLSACGGDDKKSSPQTAASSSSTHSFSSRSTTPADDNQWPNVKITSGGTKTLRFEWTPLAGATSYQLLKKIDGASSYVSVGDPIAAPGNSSPLQASDTISVHLTDWINSRYKVQACIAADCNNYSNEMITDSAMLAAIGYLKANNAEAGDWFGWSIALSGDGQTLAVGAPAEDSKAAGVNLTQDNESPNSGAVYIFTKVNGDWQQQAYLKASNTEQPSDNKSITLPNDRFGYQVAISTDGNTLAVSALMEDSPWRGVDCGQDDYEYTFSSASSQIAAHADINTGAIYIFKRAAGTWAQQTYIKPHNASLNGFFGSNISLSGDGKTLAVGSKSDNTYAAGVLDMRNASSTGCVNFLASSSSTSSSSISSSSASSSSLQGGRSSGAVYLFKETDSGWIEQAFIKAADADPDDFFGTSVSLSDDGNTLAVGATGEDSKDSSASNDTLVYNGTTYLLNNGGVYIFTQANDAWTQQSKVKPLQNGMAQQFGFSVALSGDGNSLAVGAPNDLSKSSGVEAITPGELGSIAKNYELDYPYDVGAAYLFTRQAETWTATTFFKASNAQTGYKFGHNVALSQHGDRLAVSSIEEASRATGIDGDPQDTGATASGAVYVFALTQNLWAQKSYVKAPNTDANDRFGNSIDLDDTGNILAVGAHRESSNATGVNGDKTDDQSQASGAVYFY
ncbi:MAG TPA: hypothetical protein VN030_00240 [Cellvibrio sp.]|nr:hypothetical protein [Cellvibrio sp.]